MQPAHGIHEWVGSPAPATLKSVDHNYHGFLAATHRGYGDRFVSKMSIRRSKFLVSLILQRSLIAGEEKGRLHATSPRKRYRCLNDCVTPLMVRP